MQIHSVPLTTFLGVVDWRYVATALALLVGTVFTEEMFGRRRGAASLDAPVLPGVVALPD